MLLFDLDGTLIDSNQVWSQIDLEFLGERGFSCPPDYSNAVAHMTYPEAARYTKERFHLPESPEQIQTIWTAMAMDQYRSRLPLKEGVMDFLTAQASNGSRLGIVTSCMEPLCQAVLCRHGLWSLFERITTTAQVERGKAYPDIYLLAARLAGVPPETCTMFDDSPVAVAGAKAAGMRVIGVYDPFYESRQEELRSGCDRWIRSFRQLTGENSFL